MDGVYPEGFLDGVPGGLYISFTKEYNRNIETECSYIGGNKNDESV